MYTLNIILKSSSLMVSLVYKSYKSATDNFNKVQNSISESRPEEEMNIEDDYDTKACCRLSDISAVTFGDFTKDLNRNGEMAILQAKANIRTQQLASNDAGLKLLNSTTTLNGSMQ